VLLLLLQAEPYIEGVDIQFLAVVENGTQNQDHKQTHLVLLQGAIIYQRQQTLVVFTRSIMAAAINI
jgi:hypothetical protein